MNGLLLLLCFFLSIVLTTRQLALAGAASSSKVVTSLPGFQGPLPFHLETGYVEVDEDNGTELFYYFVESEAGGENDPFLLWLTGGAHCSVLSGLAFEIGPFKFVIEPYNGSVPSLEINPNSWTKVAHILFVDSPAGAGFSFSKQPKGYDVGEVSTSLQLHEFLIKWISDHPKFLSSPLYIGGDSYAGKFVPFIAQKISEGNEVGRRPLLNLKFVLNLLLVLLATLNTEAALQLSGPAATAAARRPGGSRCCPTARLPGSFLFTPVAPTSARRSGGLLDGRRLPVLLDGPVPPSEPGGLMLLLG